MRELLRDEEHNADGTYWFPPAPRSASQTVSFWMTVEVPDRVLRRLRDAHRQVRREAQFHHEVVPEIPRSDLRAWCGSPSCTATPLNSPKRSS